MDERTDKIEFPTTRWTVIENAGGNDKTSALNDLLKIYLPALTVHLMSSWRMPREQAQDYIQGFATDKVLRAQLLSRADRKRGRFRNFLLTSLENYVISILRKDESRQRTAMKFGEIAHPGDVKGAIAESKDAFDIILVNQMIEETLQRMKEECCRSKREAIWELFNGRVLRPLMHGEQPAPYASLVKKLGFKSPVQASNALITGKRMFSRLFRDVFAQYEQSGSRIEDEIAEVRNLLKKYGLESPIRDPKRK